MPVAGRERLLRPYVGYLGTPRGRGQQSGAAHGQVIEDTSLLYDRAWNTQANTHLADLHQTVREAKEVVPPASAEDLHADYLRKAAELQAFANIFRPAIDNTDTQLMAQGNEHLSTATDLTLALKEKVVNFCG